MSGEIILVGSIAGVFVFAVLVAFIRESLAVKRLKLEELERSLGLRE